MMRTEDIQSKVPVNTLLYIHRVNKAPLDSVVIYEVDSDEVSASWFSLSDSKRRSLGASQRSSAYGINSIDSNSFTIPLLPEHVFKVSSDRKSLIVNISNVECKALYVRLVFRPPELRPAYVEIVGQDVSDPSNILNDRYEGISTQRHDESTKKSSSAMAKTTLVHDLVVIRRSIPSFSSSSSSTTVYTTVFFVLSWIAPALGFICIGLGIMYALARRHALTSLRGSKTNRGRANTESSSSYPSEEKIIMSWLDEVPSEVRSGMEFVSPFIRVLSLCVEYVERLTTGEDTKRLYRVLYVVIVFSSLTDF